MVALASLAGCGGSHESGGGGHVINLSGGVGGNGAVSIGGTGGYFRIKKIDGGGDVKTLNGGAANAVFTAASITPTLGANPAIVASSATPDLYLAGACASVTTVTTPSGKLFMVGGGDFHLYISDGTSTCSMAEAATSLQVKTGATLTLPINNGNWASLQFANDIDNQGVITALDTGTPTLRGSVGLQASSYLGTGTIDTSGSATVPDAGSAYVWMNYSVINSGALNASGGDVTTGNGGNAGAIFLSGGRYIQNTAALTAHGGATTDVAGTGGSGSFIELDATAGALRNSGLVDGRGGAGATGGSGAAVKLYGYLGGVWNSGNIQAYGANSTVGNGGNGGDIRFIGEAGDIRNSGDVLAYGGDTTDSTANGGRAFELYVYGTDNCLYAGWCPESVPMGDVTWSGAIDLHGGNAVAAGTGVGGNAGHLYADIESAGATAASNVVFAGYAALDTHGGDGGAGGDAGSYELYNYDSYLNATSSGKVPVEAGNIVSQLKVDAHGGNAVVGGLATSATGGMGGFVDIDTDYYSTAVLLPHEETVTHTGDINKVGGQNRNAANDIAGKSQYLWVWGYNGVTWNGNVTADAGSDIGAKGTTAGYGGRVDWQEWWSELGTVSFTGTLSANGGDGAYRGGSHSGIDSYAAKILWTGNITARGGNADPTTTPGSIGGDGSWVEFKATDPVDSKVSGTIDVTRGVGATAGAGGTVAGTLACIGPSC